MPRIPTPTQVLVTTLSGLGRGKTCHGLSHDSHDTILQVTNSPANNPGELSQKLALPSEAAQSG
jgi:hypothetical protein